MAVRAAQLMTVVSTAGDFAKGFVEEQAVRTCRIAMRLADRAGLDGPDRQTVFYVSLLRFVGCTATASQMAAALGDELAVSAEFAAVDTRRLPQVVDAAARVVGGPGIRRAAGVARFLALAPAVVRDHEVASCEVAQLFAERAGLPERIRAALGQVFERWDGHGHPGAAGGAGIARPVRLAQVANAAEILARQRGWAAARPALREQAGRVLDPDLVALACADPVGADEDVDLDEVLDEEPRPWLTYTDDEVDRVLAAIGAVADLKSTYLRGHSDAVAVRAATAASALGLPDHEVVAVRRAGWLHDLGRLAVSARVWDKPGPLTAGQWEQVRLHPYVTERVLLRCPELAEVAAIAGGHHERADGSGYHRAVPGTRLALLLGAADAYAALGEHRPHRAALRPADRIRALRGEVTAGRLPDWAVEAVLGTAGRGVAAVPSDPLTDRERAVLAQVARGATNRAAAQALGISPKTVNAHLERIFVKLGVSTRGAAAYAAICRGLLDAGPTPTGPDGSAAPRRP